MQRWLWCSLHKSSSYPTENSLPGLPSETLPPEWVIGCRPLWKGWITLGKALLFSWSNSQGGQHLKALCWQPSYNWVLRSSFLKEDLGDTLQCSGQSGCPSAKTHILSLNVEDSRKPMIHFHGVDRSFCASGLVHGYQASSDLNCQRTKSRKGSSCSHSISQVSSIVLT